MIILVYVDDCIIISRGQSNIEKFIESLTHGEENFIFTDEGTLSSYLGVEIFKITRQSRFYIDTTFSN